MNWFTSDCHFGHGNVIKYCNRPFPDAQSMNEVLIDNWNQVVAKDDTIFHLGDFSFMTKQATDDLIARLSGRIIFLRGNHDCHPKTVIDSLVARFEGHRILLTHYPEWASPLMLTFCGHVHEKWKVQKPKDSFPIVNVGVDVWDFKPVNLAMIKGVL